MAHRVDKKESVKIRSPSPYRSQCPFVSKPDDACFSAGTTSQSADATIRLCGGDFQACEIYKQKVGGNIKQIL